MVTLQEITPHVALVFKAVRLRALEDSPTSFTGTYAREALLSDEEWIERAAHWSRQRAIGYIACDGEFPCGMVACRVADNHPDHADVASMWVDSAYRKAGVGRLLIEALKVWAVAQGFSELRLMVTDVNPAAKRFYQRLGFRFTGMSQPYPNDSSITESEMAMPLS